MWIAKPLGSLSIAEREAWLRTQDPNRPLSQTLAWFEAAEVAGGKVLVVFSPEEGVGGAVHAIQSGDYANDFAIDYECTNGPILRWTGDEAPRQVATFAMAVAKASGSFRSMTFRPRWSESSNTQGLLNKLPLPSQRFSRAETLVTEIRKESGQQSELFSPRLLRTLEKSRHAGVRAERRRLDAGSLESFVRRMQAFGRKRGFFVPNGAWFHALVFGGSRGGRGLPREDLRFLLVESKLSGAARAQCEILCCVRGADAHYLFGWEDRSGDIPGSVSPAALAHVQALGECAEEGAKSYDFNGYLDPDTPENAGHPYLGVSRFKAQFGGRVVRYVCPEFRIDSGEPS